MSMLFEREWSGTSQVQICELSDIADISSSTKDDFFLVGCQNLKRNPKQPSPFLHSFPQANQMLTANHNLISAHPGSTQWNLQSFAYIKTEEMVDLQMHHQVTATHNKNTLLAALQPLEPVNIPFSVLKNQRSTSVNCLPARQFIHVLAFLTRRRLQPALKLAKYR